MPNDASSISCLPRAMTNNGVAVDSAIAKDAGFTKALKARKVAPGILQEDIRTLKMNLHTLLSQLPKGKPGTPGFSEQQALLLANQKKLGVYRVKLRSDIAELMARERPSRIDDIDVPQLKVTPMTRVCSDREMVTPLSKPLEDLPKGIF